MTVRELFAKCNTYFPLIVLYGKDCNDLFVKEPGKVLGKCRFLDNEVDFIGHIDIHEIRIKVDQAN